MSSLSYEQFKVLHSETIMCCQIIEGDLKWIYAFMHKGDPDENRSKVSNYTLGQIVNKLKELDNSDGKPYISASDYNFLSQMTEKETTGVINVIGTFCTKIIGFLQKIMRRYATSYKKTTIGLILYIRTLSRLKSN